MWTRTSRRKAEKPDYAKIARLEAELLGVAPTTHIMVDDTVVQVSPWPVSTTTITTADSGTMYVLGPEEPPPGTEPNPVVLNGLAYLFGQR